MLGSLQPPSLQSACREMRAFHDQRDHALDQLAPTVSTIFPFG